MVKEKKIKDRIIFEDNSQKPFTLERHQAY
jgi:hypothetical protein